MQYYDLEFYMTDKNIVTVFKSFLRIEGSRVINYFLMDNCYIAMRIYMSSSNRALFEQATNIRLEEAEVCSN